MAKDRKPAPFPSKDDIFAFVRDAKGKVSKREIARAFAIKGQEKILLKKSLREMIQDGLLAQDNHKSLRPADRLPPVQVIEFAGVDKFGDPLARIVSTHKTNTDAATIYIDEKGKSRVNAMGNGDRALARLTLIKENPATYRAEIIKRLEKTISTIMGVFHGTENGGRVTPVDKKNRDEFIITPEHINNAIDGELVLAEAITQGKRQKVMGLKNAKVVERLGDVTSAKTVSLIAIYTHDIPHEFPADVLKEAENIQDISKKNRIDLTSIPLITIDPSDARDHDDAIWAEADNDPNNPDGWHVIVAIADVAHFVKEGSLLDKEAQKRGNSCYFPDRVVPMLPETLSAGLCSLMPNETRACLAVHMWFDKNGNKLRHRFERAIMRSAANISYERVEATLRGSGTDEDALLLEPVLKPLHGAFKSIMKAREKRAPLDLDMPERKIILSQDGTVEDILLKERLDAHRIVEEMMIAANVCAAETLEHHKILPMYRIHDEPAHDKVEMLRDFLQGFNISLAKGQVVRPKVFNTILDRVRDTASETVVNQVVLRSQMQALYSTENRGHFGLALTHYAHFTSPIRRYADLLVHRGLIRAIKAGKDGLSDMVIDEMDTIADHISGTERRAMKAERESTDRYLAAFLKKHIGEEFEGVISGVTRFGLFITLEPSGGDGLIPMRDLANDYYVHDEASHSLVGERSGQRYQLGQKVAVRLEEANHITGGIRLSLLDQPKGGSKNKRKFGKNGPHKGKKSRPTKRPKKSFAPKTSNTNKR